MTSDISRPMFIQTDEGEYINVAHVARFRAMRNMLNKYSAEAQLITGDWVTITNEAESEVDALETFNDFITIM
ncbi:hypothetical protein [Deinococcus soli (ex Cha et al. 2016)]|uniref:hypothetical protein n=1 Tax=Deinococcus soli (ex Cha et al. 2016) TaxID=1309411 RepID=UPI0016655F74|nr:hypothetical protein [Deinococcus soli (ex Cha et al. 2016)]GGB71378.1 hypothetical protein GCM10008019_29450 [Deinococcus soli (ex Cha et al. 2016)]